MSQYSLPVAMFDFVPVAASAAGLRDLAGVVRQQQRSLGPAAVAAAVVIVVAGACKAIWKLLIALDGEAPSFLQDYLFHALSAGFLTLAFCLHHATRGAASGPAPWLRLTAWTAAPLAGAVAAAQFGAPRAPFFWLIAWTTLGSAALCWNAIAACRGSGLGLSTQACFAWNFLAALALAGLARLPATETSAWMQESVNFSAQLALALGAWRLRRQIQESFT